MRPREIKTTTKFCLEVPKVSTHWSRQKIFKWKFLFIAAFFLLIIFELWNMQTCIKIISQLSARLTWESLHLFEGSGGAKRWREREGKKKEGNSRNMPIFTSVLLCWLPATSNSDPLPLCRFPKLKQISSSFSRGVEYDFVNFYTFFPT